jgi:heptosyltransferase-2
MKLIVRAPNWVGDAVMALPAVDAIRDLTGADHLAIMARAATAGLFVNHPDVDRVVVIDDRSSRLHGAWRSAGLIRVDRYDIGLVLPPSFSSGLIFKLAGVKGRIGFTGDKRGMLLTRAVTLPAETMHRTKQYLYLVEQLTGKRPPVADPRLHLSHENLGDGEAVLRGQNLSYDDAYVVISPQAVGPSRRWGTDNYGRLAKRLIDILGCRVVLLGTNAETVAGEAVRACDPAHIVNLCGLTGLMSAAAIISFARLFVGNDSGLAHVAAAVGCPLVVLSGPDDPEETSPVSAKKRVIIKNIDCINCVRNVCPKRGEAFMRCMTLITVDEVFDAATALSRT